MFRSCSTGYTGSIHMNALGSGHRHTYSHRGQKQFQQTSHTPAKGQHMTGLII